MLTKQIMNECFGVSPLIFDNNLCRYNSNIKSFENLKELLTAAPPREHKPFQQKQANKTDMYILYTSRNAELWRCLKECCPPERIIKLTDFTLDHEPTGSYGSLLDNPHVKQIGRFCCFASGVDAVLNHPLTMVTNHSFIYDFNPVPEIDNQQFNIEDFNKKFIIGNDVWLGKNVILTNGVKIGNGVRAAAGAVITRDVPDYAVVAGVPARIIKYRFTPDQIKKLNEIAWWNWPVGKIRACYEDFTDIEIFLERHYQPEHRVTERSKNMLTEELLQFIQDEKNDSMEFVRLAQARSAEVYLYGAGAYLRCAVQFMQKYHIGIKAILDSNKQGEFQGIPIVRFPDFLASNPDPESWFVISAPSAAEEITDTLAKYFKRENIHSFEAAMYVSFIPDIDEYRKYLTAHWQELCQFSNSLADDKSRETLASVLKGRISGRKCYFEQCYASHQYYPEDIIRFSPGEVMAELGANNGETLLEFLRRCPEYKSAYCFELDTVCVSVLKTIVKDIVRGGGTISIIPKGAWDSSAVLEFFSDTVESGVSRILTEDRGGTANCRIETAAVDDVVKEPITYLKMDIEGAELRALHGAKQQIAENRPKLAVCVYHRITDFLDIWNYLRELVPEYRFYLRHHDANCGTETVLYAVEATPEESGALENMRSEVV